MASVRAIVEVPVVVTVDDEAHVCEIAETATAKVLEALPDELLDGYGVVIVQCFDASNAFQGRIVTRKEGWWRT